MTILEYIRNLNRLKNLAVNRFGKLGELETDVVNSAFDWIVDNLEIKRGTVFPDELLTQAMDEFVGAVGDAITGNKLFQSKVSSFLVDLKTIQDNNKKFHATTNNFNIETAGVTKVQKIVVNEIIDQYTGNGLNVHFAEPLRDSVFRNILAGANMKEIRQVLNTYVLSGKDKSGKLGQYLGQTAQQAADLYTGAINQQIAKEFDVTGYIISGSIIQTSSEQCIYAIDESEDGYLSFKDWKEVLAIAEGNKRAPLIKGTTIENLPINKLHWGCRHDFTPIIKQEKNV